MNLPHFYVHSAWEQEGTSEMKTALTVSGASNGVSSRSDEYQQRMKQLRELQKKERDEKRKIADQIKADRRETDQREAKASVSYKYEEVSWR